MAGLPRWPSGLRQRTSNPCYAGSNPARGALPGARTARGALPGAPNSGRAAAERTAHRGYRWPNMDNQGDGWRHSVMDRLKPLAYRLVHVLGGTLPERGISYEELVHLLYPTLPEALRFEVDQAGAGDLTRVSTIRRMLGTIEHQVAPTAFSVQLADEDVARRTSPWRRALLRRRRRRRDPGSSLGVQRPTSHRSLRARSHAGNDGGRQDRRQPGVLLAAGVPVGRALGQGHCPGTELEELPASCCPRCGWAGSPTSS